MFTLRIISCENKDNPELFSLETKVTGAVHISVEKTGAAVNNLPVHTRLVPVYHILFAEIEFHQVEFRAVLWIVTTNELPNISEIVNLWFHVDDAVMDNKLDRYCHIFMLFDKSGECQK